MAKIHGTGPAAEAAALALSGLESAGLTLWVAPTPLADEGALAAQAALEALYLAPLRLAERLIADLPEPLRDASGEPVAQRQLLLLVERRLLASGSGRVAERAAMAALLAWVEEAALSLAPKLRLNVLALPLETPPDLAPSLGWLCNRAVVTGQVVKLGPPPPSTAPFRGNPR